MLKMKKYILLLLGLFLLVGCTTNNEFKEAYESINGQENAQGKIHRTITIDKNNPFEEVSADKIVEMIENKETFYVYFGDELCPWCRSVIEKFIEVAKKNNIKKVYYVKIWDKDGNEILRDKYILDDKQKAQLTIVGTESYKKLLTYFDSVLSDYTLTDVNGNTINVGEKRIFAPNFMYVENGNTIKMVSGISEKQTDPREELTTEILADEEKQFTEFFKE